MKSRSFDLSRVPGNFSAGPEHARGHIGALDSSECDSRLFQPDADRFVFWRTMRHPPPLIPAQLLLFGVFTTSCGTEDAPAELSQAIVTVAAGAPVFGANPASSELLCEGTITALYRHAGTLLVGTDIGLFALKSGALEPVLALDENGTSMSIGPVSCIGPRLNGILVVAGNALFYDYDDYLIRSPASDIVADRTVTSIGSTEDSAGEVMYMATTDGLFQVTETQLSAITIPSMSGPPLVVGVREDVTLVGYESGLVELASDYSVTTVPGVTSVHAVLTLNAASWIATDEGILERGSDGSYVRYSLDESGEGVPTWALAVNYAGDIVGASGLGLVAFSDTQLAGIAALSGIGGGVVLAPDAEDNLYLGIGSTLTEYQVGAPVSFATTIAPIFGVACNSCHLNGASAPAHDFTNYDETLSIVDDVLERVLSGQMPPTLPLEAYEYEALILWSESGMNP